MAQSQLTQNDQKIIDALKKLPADYWDFKTADVREYTHGLHNYPAMMVCPISRKIIVLVRNIRPIHTLLDPFMGSGTVLVEGMLAGIPLVYGTDVNPLALFLSKVKTTPLDNQQLQQAAGQLYKRLVNKYQSCAALIDQADEIMRRDYQLDLTAKNGWGSQAPVYLNQFIEAHHLALTIPQFKNMGYWFKPRVILLLSLIKTEIDQVEQQSIKDFMFVAFSETIRFVSNRRNGEFKMFRMKAEQVEAFAPDVIQKFADILTRNIDKMKAFSESSLTKTAAPLFVFILIMLCICAIFLMNRSI